MQPEEIRVAIKKIRELTNKPFAVNLFITDIAYNTDLQLEKMRKILEPIEKSYL